MNVLLCFKTDSLPGKLVLRQVLKISIPASSIRESSLMAPASPSMPTAGILLLGQLTLQTLGAERTREGSGLEDIQESQTRCVGSEATQYQRFLVKSGVKDFFGAHHSF